MKKKIIIGIVVIMAIVLVAIFANQSKNSEVIKIGFIGPLTGDASPYGIPVKQGIELALQDAIEKGVIKEGQIEIIWEDGKCDGKEAVAVAQKLINVDKVKIIFGGQCSTETMAFAPIAESAGVLVFSSFSTSPDVTNAGDYVFRAPPSDSNTGKVIAETMSKDGFKKIGIISEQFLAAQTIVPFFEKALMENNTELIAKESFVSDTQDVATVVTKVINLNPDAIYVNVQTGAVGSRVVKQLKDLGYKGQIYTYFITSDDFVKAGPWVNGTKIIDGRAAKSEEILAEFLESFREFYGSDPSYPLGATLGYDSGAIVFEAIDRVGGDPDKLKSYLYKMEPRSSLTGNLSFDENGDPLGNDYYYLVEVVDNKLVTIK
jgi:branched-chain amino acid transport system substrate-binding protein